MNRKVEVDMDFTDDKRVSYPEISVLALGYVNLVLP